MAKKFRVLIGDNLDVVGNTKGIIVVESMDRITKTILLKSTLKQKISRNKTTRGIPSAKTLGCVRVPS